MANIRENSYEGGSQGTTIDGTNSGGASGSAFDQISIGSANTLIYDSANAKGTLAGKHSFGGTATGYHGWTGLGTLTVDTWFRIYFTINQLPSSTWFGFFRPAVTGGTRCCDVGIRSDGLLRFSNAADSEITAIRSTVAVSPGTRYRLELRVKPGTSAGELEWKLFADDSTTPLETNSATALALGASLDSLRFGCQATAANVNGCTVTFDEPAVSTDGWIGPAGGAGTEYPDSGTAIVVIRASSVRPMFPGDDTFPEEDDRVLDVLEASDSGTAIVSIEASGSDVHTSGGTEYVDSGTAQVSIIGSATEGRESADEATGIVSVIPSALEERVSSDAETGIISIEASSADTAQFTDVSTTIVSVEASGTDELVQQGQETGTAIVSIATSGTDIHEAEDANTTILSIVASGNDSITGATSDSGTATVSIISSAIETKQAQDTNQAILSVVASGTDTLTSGFADSGTAQVSIVPSATQTSQFKDSATAIVTILPGAVELYEQHVPAIVSIVPSATFADEFTGLGLTGAGFYRRWTATLSRTRLLGAGSVRFSARLVSRWEASAYKRYVGKEGK